MLMRAANFIGRIALFLSGCAWSQPVADAQAACAVATSRVTAQRDLPPSHVARCDSIPEADGLNGYYILALFAHCSEEVCGSTNMGWFAVRKATGEVFEWDVAEWKIGQPVGSR